MSWSDTLGDLQKGIYQLDCPRMTLQNRLNSDCVFIGAGYVRQNHERKLEFKLYCQFVKENHKFLFFGKSAKSGELVPENEYYILKCIDGFNREWISYWVNPSFDVGVGVVFSGDLRELVHIKDRERPMLKQDYLILRIFGEIKVPFNHQTESISKIADKEFKTINWNIARFSSSNYNFTISLKDGWTLIKIEGNPGVSFPKNIELRAIEALEFVLAHSLWWSVMEKYTCGTLETKSIRTHFFEFNEPRIGPPIDFRNKDSTGCIWSLFDKYFSYIIDKQENEKLHPISEQLNLIREASQGPIIAEALALSIAVEAILKSEFVDLCKPSDALRTGVNSACKHFDDWSGTDELKNRLKGSLNSILNSNPQNAMKFLIDNNVITKKQMDAWKKLRNSMAHGVQPNDAKLQEFLTLCDTVCVLLYHIIFYAIGYEGKYTDYSVFGWPIEDFPKKYFDNDGSSIGG